MTCFQWALIELSRNETIQAKLREELTSHFRNGIDPTYDQLTTGFPYLNAVVHEILRLHAPVWETARIVRSTSLRTHNFCRLLVLIHG
jgi:cytochrome P450